ncbi:hypothetical protein AMATHDRAFT_135274 [Amanita thiersii Skay4041]|uniref:Uncharacterized protein n=1 Tax=Amanita thiersii Skay4041 TaxID=703135 RepID=A0A2A9NUI6_9AGAR|nr:hypothetical protein AMATHDRAFT_135274 [Amanita thiersii Skay4041]
MDSTQFEQDLSISQNHVSELPSTYLPNLPPSSHQDAILQNQLLQDPPASFASVSANSSSLIPSMHLSISDLPPSAFMSPMEAVESAPQLRSAPPAFLTDYNQTQVDPFSQVTPLDSAIPIEMSPSNHPLSVSPSQSQLPSPSIHGPPSTYSVAVSATLSPTLDPSAVANGHPIVATSVPANAVPPSFISLGSASQQPINLSFPSPVGQPQPAMAETEPHLILGEMLNAIAKTASSAGDACRMRQGAEATHKVDELKQRILRVSEMLSFMTVGTSPSVVDLSRKRSASDMEEERTVKALKRESSDDMLLVHVPETPSSISPLVFAPSTESQLVTSAVPPSETVMAPSRPTSPPSTFPGHRLIEPVKQQQLTPIISEFPPFIPPSQGHVIFDSGIATPMASTSPTFPDFCSSWSDTAVSHRHPLSAASVQAPSVPTGTNSITEPLSTFTTTQLCRQLPSTVRVHGLPQDAEVLRHSIGRLARSNSMSGPVDGQFEYSYLQYPNGTTGWTKATQSLASDAHSDAPPRTNWVQKPSDSSFLSASPSAISDVPSTVPSTARSSPTDDEDDDSTNSEGNDKSSLKVDQKLLSSESSSSVSDVPAEYKKEVDRIFFEYLNKICSNLDATDSKGEPIHQTLMAKKMQRLDESPDFRPFKFRIQAFTLAFLEELARQGYPEEKIPMKKIRNYLWKQQYILRFNEDGKKAKSKGNHIWNIEAKKTGDGKWEFRPFHRKLAGNPPSVAYCGLKWSWTPRVWDPQASWQNVPVKYSSPSLPSWLNWKDDVLSGIPPPDAEDCTITANANYVLDGQEGQLSHTFTITIAPVSAIDTISYPRSRRPSMAGDTPRRSTSDSYLCQSNQRSSTDIKSDGASESPDTRVIRVLQQAAQKVTMEAKSQLVAGVPETQDSLEDLAKQKHVLEQTVDAYDKELSGQSHSQTRRLAVAAQHVVVQAAHTVIADKTGGIVIPQSEVTAIQSVTLSELSEATQDAIAEAVKMKGTATNDVDIMITATSILKARAPNSPTTSVESLPSSSNSPVATNNVVPSPSQSPGLGTSRLNIGSGYTPNLSSLPEYV